MASTKPIPCGPCQEENVNIKAELWCPNCKEGLCSTCSGHHKRSKGTRDHKTIDIKSYKPSTQAIKTECGKHGQQLHLYCPIHLMPCCDECISTSHSKCKAIQTLASVVEKTKIEKSIQSSEKQIDSILHFLDKLIHNKSKNISRGEQDCESIHEFILKIRKKVNNHLTNLENKLCNETKTIFNQEKSEATGLIAEIEEKQKNLKEIQEQLHTVILSTSKLQSFLGIHQIEQQVHQYQRYADDLEENDGAKDFGIRMKQNDEIESILSKLGSLESLGEVMAVKTETDLNRETNLRREAQVESQEHSNINSMTMNMETKVAIKMGNSVRGMICLMDGRFIVVEYDGKVSLLTSHKLQKQLPIPGRSFGVAQINQDTIAITNYEEKAIKIFNMENKTVTKFITLDKQCYGLSFSNNSLAVGLSKEIRIIDVEGNLLKSIPVQSQSPLCNILYCNDRVIYSDFGGQKVCCVDESGKQIWKYTQDIKGPLGLCTDNYGNIIVADRASNRIIVISKDGQNSKVLISEDAGLNVLECICFKHDETSCFICNGSRIYLAKFN
ncbi:uncharacterized protein LOC134727326 [Mytilus trossulus]|uniref:uncharacterized protein LOC134727326 n=1 Tax=Mytilus trossulus TaxID=6551 RepID=UPI0030052A35